MTDYVMVPVEPTPEMERAAFDALGLTGSATESGTQMRNRVYAAMLAARPPAEQPAPVVAHPGGWEGAEEWMPLAWELCAEENGEEACTELVWEGGPIPEPWGERWLKYEDEAKRLIALVRKHVPTPQAEPLNECNDNDSPWLVCKPCAAAGKCAQVEQAQPVGEMVDGFHHVGHGDFAPGVSVVWSAGKPPAGTKLYTSPPKAEAQPLQEMMRHVRRLMAHVDEWTRWYGASDVLLRHQLPLPPSGTVRIMEDLEEAIKAASHGIATKQGGE